MVRALNAEQTSVASAPAGAEAVTGAHSRRRQRWWASKWRLGRGTGGGRRSV